LPQQAVVRPKKPRKLLILDLCVAGYIHASIPHANLALDLMGRKTGAYEPVFSNDLENLKYPRIKDFDAVFLNDTVGEVFPDPAVREGLLRYVREGGGLGALHGATYAARNWPEFGELIGAMDAPHRIEPAVLKIEDPRHPLTKAFRAKEFPYTEEYYRFYDEGPTAFYSRDKLRVLLSIHTAKTDMSKAGLLQRKDGDYGLAWIRSYGNGRVFTNAMGHTTEFFMTPQLAAHVLAGIQFILGDLPADTTPSGRLARK
jgi:type 1 glutamine amidotransferase